MSGGSTALDGSNGKDRPGGVTTGRIIPRICRRLESRVTSSCARSRCTALPESMFMVAVFSVAPWSSMKDSVKGREANVLASHRRFNGVSLMRVQTIGVQSLLGCKQELRHAVNDKLGLEDT
jgi:hypothetical protein